MRLRIWFAGLAVLAMLVTASPATAQMMSRSFHLEGGVSWVSLSGDDFEDTDAGIGFDIAAVLGLNSRWSLGAGVQRTTHGTEDDDVDIAALQIYAEPRFKLPAHGMLTPYLFGRAAYVRGSSETSFGDAEATGTGFGAGIGVMFGGSGRFMFQVAASFNTISLGDAEIDGTTAPGTEASGSAFGLKGGVTISLGGGGM